jgi:glycosyltransferase involved in cell wall biosynthesis
VYPVTDQTNHVDSGRKSDVTVSNSRPYSERVTRTADSPSRLVAHILPFPAVGGTEQATLRIMKAVEPFGYSGVAMLLEDTEELRQFFGDSGRTALGWPAPTPSLRHGKTFLAESRALAKEFRRLKVSLVHCSDFKAAWHASLAGRLAGVPVICHIRNRCDSLIWRDRLFMRPVSHFAFVSRDTWKGFPIHVPPNRGTVIYDGINPPPPRPADEIEQDRRAVRTELGLTHSVRVIGMLARVAPQKDYDTLVRAAVRVVQADPTVRFVVSGDCSAHEVSRKHYAYVQGLIQQSGLSDYFLFTGYRPDVMRLLAAFDISVLSTHFEGLPLALLESMAHAKPVVATAVDGIPEVIVDGVNGFLTAHQDAEALAARLIELIQSPSLAERLGQAARQTVLTDFTAEKFARSVADLYARFVK